MVGVHPGHHGIEYGFRITVDEGIVKSVELKSRDRALSSKRHSAVSETDMQTPWKFGNLTDAVATARDRVVAHREPSSKRHNQTWRRIVRETRKKVASGLQSKMPGVRFAQLSERPVQQLAWRFAGVRRETVQVAAAMFLGFALSGCSLLQRDRSEPPAPLPSIEAVTQPQVLWTRSIGSGGDRNLWRARPGVEGNRVWAVDGLGRLTAFDRETGAAITELRSERARVTAGVGVGGGRVVFGDIDGRVHAFDTARGAEVWVRQLDAAVGAVSDLSAGRVVVRTFDGRLLALSAETGETLWTALRSTPALSLTGQQTPLLLPGRVLTGFDSGRLVMFGIERGAPVWDVALAVPAGRSDVERLVDIDGRMATGGGAVFVASFQGRLAALSLDRGAVAWTRPFSSVTGVALDQVSGTLLAVSDEDHLFGFDAREGRDRWETRDLRLRRLTSPVVVDGHGVIGDFDGYLHWIDLRDGRLVARARVGSRAVLPELVEADGVIFGLTADGRLFAVDGRLAADSQSGLSQR